MSQSAQEESMKENLQPSQPGAHECSLFLESDFPIQMKVEVSRFENSIK